MTYNKQVPHPLYSPPPPHHCTTSISVHWTRPPINHLKLNFDGSLKTRQQHHASSSEITGDNSCMPLLLISDPLKSSWLNWSYCPPQMNSRNNQVTSSMHLHRRRQSLSHQYIQRCLVYPLEITRTQSSQILKNCSNILNYGISHTSTEKQIKQLIGSRMSAI